MPHAPFIIASYAAAAVLLAWCAFTPLLHLKKLKRGIQSRNHATESDHASSP